MSDVNEAIANLENAKKLIQDTLREEGKIYVFKEFEESINIAKKTLQEIVEKEYEKEKEEKEEIHPSLPKVPRVLTKKEERFLAEVKNSFTKFGGSIYNLDKCKGYLGQLMDEFWDSKLDEYELTNKETCRVDDLYKKGLLEREISELEKDWNEAYKITTIRLKKTIKTLRSLRRKVKRNVKSKK